MPALHRERRRQRAAVSATAAVPAPAAMCHCTTMPGESAVPAESGMSIPARSV